MQSVMQLLLMENLGIYVVQFAMEAAVVEIEMVVRLLGWCRLIERKVGRGD